MPTSPAEWASLRKKKKKKKEKKEEEVNLWVTATHIYLSCSPTFLKKKKKNFFIKPKKGKREHESERYSRLPLLLHQPLGLLQVALGMAPLSHDVCQRLLLLLPLLHQLLQPRPLLHLLVAAVSRGWTCCVPTGVQGAAILVIGRAGWAVNVNGDSGECLCCQQWMFMLTIVNVDISECLCWQ